MVDRLRGSGCPRCKIVGMRTEITEEARSRWAEPFPLTKDLSFKRKFRWRCAKGHITRRTVPVALRDPSGCRFCACVKSNRVDGARAVPPHVLQEWVETKRPFDGAPTKKKYWFKHVCVDPRYPRQIPCGRRWRTSIDKRLHGYGCPYCKSSNLRKQQAAVAPEEPKTAQPASKSPKIPGATKATPELVVCAVQLRAAGALSARQIAKRVGLSLPTYKKYETMGLFSPTEIR
jgi:hypothetical protein